MYKLSTFFNRDYCSNKPIYNFFEESLYFDGISNILGYRRIGMLKVDQLKKGIVYQRTALTIIKVVLYICFPQLILFTLIGKAICRYFSMFEGKNKVSVLYRNNMKKSNLGETKISYGKIDIRGYKWLDNYHLRDYFLFLKQEHKHVFFSYFHATFLNIQDWFSSEAVFSCYNVSSKCVSLLDYKFIAIPVHVSGNHWTLLFIDRNKRTVEYYDSKQNYGNYQEGVKILKEATEELSKKDPGSKPYVFSAKIKKKLQPDSYQCGCWVLYFLEQRLKNPEVDFNKLDISQAQEMIAKYRISVMKKFIEMQKRNELIFYV